MRSGRNALGGRQKPPSQGAAHSAGAYQNVNRQNKLFRSLPPSKQLLLQLIARQSTRLGHSRQNRSQRANA